jgi:hypothetical protein
LKGRCKVDLEFSYTAAHEIGHNILRSYAEGGGGSADYSYKHKGSSRYSETKSISEGGVIYPRKGEIDLMKYYIILHTFWILILIELLLQKKM